MRLFEGSAAVELRRDGAGVRARTAGGSVRARRAVLATSAFPPLVRAIRRYIVPVYDYVLVTEPLSAAQWAAVGWEGREGLADMPNQFHYYRRTADGRILWGGYDAIYYHRGDVGAHRDQREASFRTLAANFARTFPQLEGLRFSHRWGGAIDTCSRFSVMFGEALGGRAAYVVGFTGLGVGASRFGARTALDLVDGRDSERTRLELVRRRPLPFPPEPLRSAAINLTRRELARADRNAGRRGVWLRTLDRLGTRLRQLSGRDRAARTRRRSSRRADESARMTNYAALRTWAVVLRILGYVGVLFAIVGVVVWAVEADGFWQTLGVIFIGGPLSIFLATYLIALGEMARAIADVGDTVRGPA